MPEGRLQRTRARLHEGYQFGDSAPFDPLRAFDLDRQCCANEVHVFLDAIRGSKCVCGGRSYVPPAEYFDVQMM